MELRLDFFFWEGVALPILLVAIYLSTRAAAEDMLDGRNTYYHLTPQQSTLADREFWRDLQEKGPKSFKNSSYPKIKKKKKKVKLSYLSPMLWFIEGTTLFYAPSSMDGGPRNLPASVEF